jgi:putative DNA primase/helicase
VKVIEADSRGAGHSWATLRRAQKELGIVSFRADGIGNKGKWCWRLDQG